MIYKVNGKSVQIPKAEIEKNMEKLELSENEAIQLWLEDNGYEVNEEQEILDSKAKQARIDYGVDKEKGKKLSSPKKVKVSDEKKELFESILKNLDRTDGVYRKNITVLKENKLIQVKIGEKTFKIDLIETRPPKEK